MLSNVSSLVQYNVLDYGAIPDNTTINTYAITKAIVDASARGGGLVVFPPGAYLTGGLNLSSNVYLYLQAGAQLQASHDVLDYPYDWDRWDLIHGLFFRKIIIAWAWMLGKGTFFLKVRSIIPQFSHFILIYCIVISIFG